MTWGESEILLAVGTCKYTLGWGQLASTRSVFESFSPVHIHENAKTVETRYNLQSTRNASSIWCVTSWYSKTSAFVRPHVNEKYAFKKSSLWDSFWKPVFLVPKNVGYVCTES